MHKLRHATLLLSVCGAVFFGGCRKSQSTTQAGKQSSQPQSTQPRHSTGTSDSAIATDPGNIPQSPDEFTAQVIRVIDGDTIKVNNGDLETVVVQLSGVDAPELGQAFGSEARSRLAARLEKGHVRIVFHERDALDRIAAEVFDENESINVWCVRQGLGWYNHKFNTDPAKAKAEQQAKLDRVGLWAADAPVPPWEWKNPPDDGRLYVQGSGSHYHRASCATLDSRRREVSLRDAVADYAPCKKCRPPTID